MLTHTTSIGLRRHAVDKVALARETVEVEVYGEPVRVKLARLDGGVVTAIPEYDDVARVAAAKGRAGEGGAGEARAAHPSGRPDDSSGRRLRTVSQPRRSNDRPG